jgi:hypothetical protein
LKLRNIFKAEPTISELAYKTRFSMVEFKRFKCQVAAVILEFRMQRINFKKIILQKYRMARSFFPTSAFQLPTSIILILVQIFTPAVQLVANTENHNSGTLSATLEKTTVPVGGLIWLTLDYRLPQGGRLPEKIEIKGLENIDILKQAADPGQIRLQLLADKIGSWQSEPISLTYLDELDQRQVLITRPISIQITSNLSKKTEEAELRPIRDIVPIKSIWQSYLIWLAAVVVLALIGLGLFWGYKRRRKPAGPAEYNEPPDVRARRELLGLEKQQYFEKGRVKTHYFFFSEILRRYLEAIRNFPAAEYTTEEIARHISAEPDRKLLPLLQQADLVKFADSVPTRARKEEDIKAALAYIRQTGPQPKTVMEQAHQREERK